MHHNIARPCIRHKVFGDAIRLTTDFKYCLSERRANPAKPDERKSKDPDPLRPKTHNIGALWSPGCGLTNGSTSEFGDGMFLGRERA
jgi:hypothetical protein